MPKNTAESGFAAPLPSNVATFFSHRKLSAEMTHPSANPAPHVQPRHTDKPIAPAAPMANIAFQIRSTALARCCSSFIFGIAHQLPDQLREPRRDSDNQ